MKDFGMLAHKSMTEGLCKEEFDELNKLAKQLEDSPIKKEKVIKNVDLIGPDVQKEVKEYRKQLPKYKVTDKIELKHIGDSIMVKPCPRCGSTVIGDNTLKINGRVHCEECSLDFKNQLIDEIKRKDS